MYEEMRSRYGFNDGDSIPFYAGEYREILVKLINSALPEDCPYEAYAFDSPWLHNSCLILWRPKGSVPDQRGNYPSGYEPAYVYDILDRIAETGIMAELLQNNVEVNPKADVIIARWAKENSFVPKSC